MFTGEHRALPVPNHLWVWATIPEEVTAAELSEFFFECGIVIPAENFSLAQNDHQVSQGVASVLAAIPFQSLEHILQWLFEEKRLKVGRLTSGEWKLTPMIKPFRTQPKPKDPWPPRNVDKVYA